MANQWGRNSLGPGQSVGWSFALPATSNFLPVISVVPLTPSDTVASWGAAGVGDYGFEGLSFPKFNQLGVSTMWSQINDYTSIVIYYLVVFNYSEKTVEYAFVEASL
jgi:hypothetical protein